MLIAHVHFTVAQVDRQNALDALLAELPAVRAMRGCRVFLPFLDPGDPCRLGVLHEWETADDFAAYAASPAFAEVGRTIRPLMTEPPESHRFDARLIETVR